MNEDSPSNIPVLFSDFFGVDKETVDGYGAFNISLVADLPLFIDPFLLFNSTKPEYRQLHEGIIRYLRFLRDKSLEHEIGEGDLKAWYYFKEVQQNWLGFARTGNRGSALGSDFAVALNQNFRLLFSEYGQEKVTRGSHLEKLCLIAGGIGRDRISDFTTNLIKDYLLGYTQEFARQNVPPDRRRVFRVPRARFSYETGTWAEGNYELPALGPAKDGYVILTPKDLLTQDETWINGHDLVENFEDIPQAIPDDALRAQVNAYFRQALGERPTKKEERDAARRTIQRFPEVVDYYIRRKEDTGDRARAVSDARVAHAQEVFLDNFTRLVDLLASRSDFYRTTGGSYGEALARVHYLKHVVEDCDGYRLFYDRHGSPVQREEDIQVAYRLTWYSTPFDVNREVNNGRGPVDYKVSFGKDATLVEFKLASNTQLKRNLEKQVEIYQVANQTQKSIKAIIFFHVTEKARVNNILRELKLHGAENVVLIDARRDNKVSASKA